MEPNKPQETLPKSTLLPYFLENKARLKDVFTLVADMLLVERIRFPERKVGGIILADQSSKQINTLMSNQPVFFRVLHVGSGYYDDTTKETVPLDIEPGAIILTSAVSANVFSSFPMLNITESDVIGVTRYNDAQAVIKNEEEFVGFLGALSAAAQTEVEKRRSGL